MSSCSVNKNGIFVSMENRGKDKKLVPWALIERNQIYPSVKHCVCEEHGIDTYLVEKSIAGNRLRRLFANEREALKALDMFLISNGKEPRHVLKRA